MDCFIKKIFDLNGKEADNLVHLQFQRFSRGEFKDKANVIYSKSKDKYSFSTSYEYANEFVRMLAEMLGNSRTQVTGVVVSTRDLTGQLNFVDKKQFAGVKQYVLGGEMSGKEIIDLLDKFPTAFFALSFKVGDSELKTKAKAPISGKPSTKGADAEIKADFCKFYTLDKDMARKIIFDKEINIEDGIIKKIEIRHIFNITDITLPPGEKDPAKMRELAKRKGKVIRLLKIDGKDIKKEANFLA